MDNGIQTNPLHEDLGQPFRLFNFNVAGGADVDEHPGLTSQNIAGHGTHTAGIMAAATSNWQVPAGYPNPPAVGGSGVCWYCSLMVAKISRIIAGIPSIDFTIDVPAAINWAVSSGVQAINMSFGGSDVNCPANPNNPFCLALASASAKEVVIAAAAGNSDARVGGSGNALGTTLEFPAVTTYTSTIAVGATQSYSGVRGNLWTEEAGQEGFRGSSTGLGMETRGILAPGRDILSTFYTGRNWNPPTRCGTDATFPNGQPGTSRGPNYGICTGTSMAAPHITGIVGLLRTINPLLTASQIRSMLLNSGDNAGAPNAIRGFGVPNVSNAVSSVLSTTNRLTPLFSLYSSSAWDHFYTVVPQMARASIAFGLLPNTGTATQYLPYGTQIDIYQNFPQPALIGYVSPRAQVWVFTTHVNPVHYVELMPLYRLSWKCGDPGVSVCASNPNHVSHFYTTSLTESQNYIAYAYYKFDGIEGYVYPLSVNQPAGTTPLRRAYNSSRDDYALFPQQEQATMANQGYTLSLTTLGYVYLNLQGRPSY